ncbi:class I SAM-dependent methyltransferase, partial [Streptomyces kronopolitis]
RPAPVRWGLGRADLPRVAGARLGIAAVREVAPVPAPGGAGRTAVWGLPSWLGRRAPVLRALTTLVCEVRFAGARSLRRASSAVR